MEETKKFFIKAKQLLITISQVEEVKKETIKNKILVKEKNLAGLLIAQEYHKDKGVHYHIILVFPKYKFIKQPERFDYICDKPTHIEKIKDLFSTVIYCKKDKDFICWGELFEKENVAKAMDAAVVKNLVFDILERVDDFNEIYKHPLPEIRQYFLTHLKMLQIAFSYIQNQKRYKKLESLRGLEEIELNEIFSQNEGIQTISKILNEAILLKWRRPHKSKSLHIFSDCPNVGKSTLLRVLSECCPSYIYPPINWFQEYINNVFHFILWDEFSLIGWDIQFLNLFLEGQPVDLPIKYSFNLTKTDNPLVVMCSNRSLREHILKKLSVTCTCSMPEDSDILCMNTQKCRVNKNAQVQYKTLKSRIVEVKLNLPIFEFIAKHIRQRA